MQQAVDIATHLLADSSVPAPESMREAFASLRRLGVLSDETTSRMVKAVGFRNTAVHTYQEIDWAIVRSIVTERLGDFGAFIKEVDDYQASASTK